MVLLLSISFGTNETSEHSEGAGSGYVIRYSEGVQDQYRDNNRKLDNEVPRRKQKRSDPSPSNNYDFMLEGWSEGNWEAEEEIPLTSPLLLTGVSKGPRNQKKKGVLIKRREEVPAEAEEEVNTEAPPEINNLTFADTAGQKDRSPVDFSSHLASSPPIQSRTFKEQGESSRGTYENSSMMEVLKAIQNKMEEREKEWRLQQEFREEVYEKELKRRDHEWEEELQRREERFESELQRKEQEWESDRKRREE